MSSMIARNPHEPEFHTAVGEVLGSLELVVERHPEHRRGRILERLVEPERVIAFRVRWVDDRGEIRINVHGANIAGFIRVAQRCWTRASSNPRPGAATFGVEE
jgi:hypothetical protein